jgi:arsenate reductase
MESALGNMEASSAKSHRGERRDAVIPFRGVAEMKKVLFICTHNSARSQMAVGLLRTFSGDKYEAHSGGTQPSAVNPYAIRVMAEIGIDISAHRSKHVREFLGMTFDSVVTVCDNAKETCPFFPGAKEYIHQSFADPAVCSGSEEEILDCFRRSRDEIKEWIEKTFGEKS